MDLYQIAIAVAIAAVTLLLYTFFFSPPGAKPAPGALPPSAAHQRLAAQARGAVLLCGPSGSGKTALYHQLVFGAAVQTLPSSSTLAVLAPLPGGAPDAPPLRLIDCPGAARFRSQLLRFACECSAVLVVLSAAGEEEQVRGAAAVLYDLYTDAAVVARAPRVLVVANKADARGALPIPKLRLALEREMQRLKATRASVRGASGGAGGGGDAGDAPLLLGSPGVEFTFEREAPWAPPAWETSVALSTGADSPVNLQGLRSFLALQG